LHAGDVRTAIIGCYLDVLKYKHIRQYNLLSILEQCLIVQIIEVAASITHAS
jgi:hypothetical protein